MMATTVIIFGRTRSTAYHDGGIKIDVGQFATSAPRGSDLRPMAGLRYISNDYAGFGCNRR